MKTAICCLFMSVPALAMNIDDWALNGVKSADGTTIGYVYNTYGVGTEALGSKSEKAVTDLRFVCSVKGENHPIIGIRWSGWLAPSNGQFITISIDSKYTATDFWAQEGKIVFKSAYEARDIINAIKHGKEMKVTWIGADSVKYSVIYNVSNINKKIDSFNASCNTNI